MILLTGGTGFIGSHLVSRLVAQGRSVRCLVRRTSALDGLPRESVDLAYADLATGAGLQDALRGVETVIHLAGVTKARTPSDYYAGNAAATVNLVRASGGVRRFVHVSSLAAAGPSAGAPLPEDAPPHPISHYGRSKLAGEEAVRQSPLAGRAAIVRPPVVYGPRDRDVFLLIRGVSRGWMTRIGRAERWFSFVYVDDLVSGLLTAADHPAAAGQVFYIAHPSPVTWEEFGALAARLMGRTARTVAIPESVAFFLGRLAEWQSRLTGKPGILSRDKVAEACCSWVCDTARARAMLGFCASTTLESGLAQTLAWYRKAGWLKF